MACVREHERPAVRDATARVGEEGAPGAVPQAPARRQETPGQTPLRSLLSTRLHSAHLTTTQMQSVISHLGRHGRLDPTPTAEALGLLAAAAAGSVAAAGRLAALRGRLLPGPAAAALVGALALDTP